MGGWRNGPDLSMVKSVCTKDSVLTLNIFEQISSKSRGGAGLFESNTFEP